MAFRAAATALSTSSAALSAHRASTRPVAGFRTSNVLPDAASTHWPPMKFRRGAEAEIALQCLSDVADLIRVLDGHRFSVQASRGLKAPRYALVVQRRGA